MSYERDHWEAQRIARGQTTTDKDWLDHVAKLQSAERDRFAPRNWESYWGEEDVWRGMRKRRGEPAEPSDWAKFAAKRREDEDRAYRERVAAQAKRAARHAARAAAEDREWAGSRGTGTGSQSKPSPVADMFANKDLLVLGLEAGASWAEIKSAYRVLAFEHHPDRNQDSDEANDIMSMLNTAYRNLELKHIAGIIKEAVCSSRY